MCFLFFYFRESHGFASARGTVVLSRSHGHASRKGKKYMFFVFFSRESQFCFRERYGCAFVKVTAVPLGNEKNVFFVFSLSRESRFYFHERHGCDFARGTVVISREARACLFRKGKKTMLPVRFFHPVFFVWFFREKKVCQKLSTWDLVLKISTRKIQ